MWKINKFSELTNEQLYQILKERVAVFVVEQNCPYPEIDDYDQCSYHLFKEEDGKVLAYLRVLPPGAKYQEASIGRVIVKQTHRGTGLGQELLGRGMAFIAETYKDIPVKIQAQEYLTKFYGSFGFRAVSDVYLEDNIPHLDMVFTPA